MERLKQTRFQLVLAYLVYGVLVIGMASLFQQNTFQRELLSLKENGEVRLREAASRLRLQIDGYRALVNVIANEPQMAEALSVGEYDAAREVLEYFEATYGAWRIDLMTPGGDVLASSSRLLGQPRYPTALLRAASNNRLGFDQALEGGERIIRLSRGVADEGAQPEGIVVLSVSLGALEFEWPVSPEPLVFFDGAQLAFSSNRPNLLLLSRSEDPEEASFNLVPKSADGPTQLWDFRPPDGGVSEIIKFEHYVPHLDLTGVIFLDTEQARSTARLSAILVLAGGAVLGLIGAIAVQQRQGRLLEAQYSARLEARVEDRTTELRNAQNKLVEASKLAALGRLSAGVSHELNQPLGAILNFSENGQKFLARGQPDPVSQNLTLISDQVRRMTRIIGNLRAFARQEVAPTDRIDFGEVVQAALEIAGDDIAAAGVTLSMDLPSDPLVVLAGRVRLEQVLLNLISNALDAMIASDPKTLHVGLHQHGEEACLSVRDSGTGIADPSAVFEPFYSTKDLGASKGLGMGLALSFGIITRFGGTLSCRNLDQGAEFTITLPLTEVQDA